VSEKLPSLNAIEAILRNFSVREDFSSALRAQASLLSISLSTYKQFTSVNALKPATRRQAISQLRRLEKALKQLDRALGNLSAPAMMALDHQRRVLSLNWTVSIPQGIRLWLNGNYPGIGQAAFAAIEGLEANEPKPERGRRKDENIQILMQTLSDIFFAVTGKAPVHHTDPYQDGREIGTFTQFVNELFELAGIDRSAEHEARWAVDDFKKRHEFSQPPS
jgi:hypothetical protein